MKTWIDLVIDNGELVRIELPQKFEDEVWQSIVDAMKRREWWATSQFEGCSATYIGNQLDRVNMARVVGTL